MTPEPTPPDPRLDPYDYELPSERVARHPTSRREDARLLVLDGDALLDRSVSDLPALLRPEDLLVVNDTRVLRARLACQRASGGKVEILLLSGEGPEVPAMARPARRLQPGERLRVLDPTTGAPMEGLEIEIGPRQPDGSLCVRPRPSPAEVMERAGQLPIPPYLDRPEEPLDRERYQTVFAAEAGAVAAPTAGLHLGTALLDALGARGIGIARLTLHVGAGTFRNLRPEDLDQGELHPERYRLSAETAAAIAACRARGGRVVAVGTTSTRTLESAALPGGLVQPGEGITRLFIQPGFRFQVVDALLTNFHLPRSSLLMLVAAFGGRDRVMRAYEHAVKAGYRFYSYGDAMLLPARAGQRD